MYRLSKMQLDIIKTNIMLKRKYSLLYEEIFNIKNQILKGSMQYVFFKVNTIFQFIKM